MSFRNLLLVSLLFLVSCTVTKRVHRSGYHVEWHRKYTTQHPANRGEEIAKKNAQVGVGEQKNVLSRKTKIRSVDSIQTVPFVESDNEIEANVAQLIAFNDPKEFKRSVPYDIISWESDTVPQKKKTVQPEIDEDEDEMTWADAFAGIAWLLIAIGGLLLIGTFVYIFGYGGLVGLFNVLVFGGNSLLFGILGFLVFILIFLIAIGFALIVEFVLKSSLLGFIVSFALIAAGILIACIKYRRGY